MNPLITASIVSHGHGSMVGALVSSLLSCSEVALIIVTINIPESIDLPKSSKIKIIENSTQKGFGANHNFAFNLTRSPFFAVINPDISMENNPFPVLIETLLSSNVGLVAPSIVDLRGDIVDSARNLPSPISILKRVIFNHKDCHLYSQNSPVFSSEWVAGMFMLFKSDVFKSLGGFDESYFLYLEDVDISDRIWKNGFSIMLNPSVSVIHDARRDSHKKIRYLAWHIKSMLRFFIKNPRYILR